MRSKKDRIALIKCGSFSHINSAVEQILLTNFSNCHLDVVDVTNGFLNPKSFKNFYYILKEYGKNVFINGANPKKFQLRTSYFYESVRKKVLEDLRGRGYVFTFQTQSIFDASLPGVPHFVYTDHSHLANQLYPGFDPNNLFPESWINMERSIYHHSSLCFTMSTNIASSLIEQYHCSAEKVKCVYAGKNTAASTASDHIDRYRRKNILFVGVDWERKGGPLLVSAFENVLRVHPDSTLTIVGCSPGIDLPNVSVVGRIPLEDVNKYYQAASIFCMPTNIEPFGVAFIEASANRLPIIGTNIGALPDIVTEGESGFLIPPGDQLQLESRLNMLLNKPDQCQRLGRDGFLKNELRYNWNTVGATIKKHIEDIILH